MSELPVRVVAVMPEPTPYRSPLFDLLASRPELDLTVVYSSPAIAGNDWRLTPSHRHVVLRGVHLPGAERLVRHRYPITPGIFSALERARPQCVVLTGWSTFASQAAIVWCKARRVPYVLIVESHDRGARPSWRRAVKGAVVPWVVRGAASVLAAGSLARESVVARGAQPARVRTFANTIDVRAFSDKASALGKRRDELRARLGLDQDAFAILCVARLSPEKGIDVLLRATARVEPPARVILAGTGPEHAALEQLATTLGVATSFLGAVPWEDLIEVYVAADVFVLLSRFETWGVVVNEAAACGLPLVLSEGAGSAHDLLRDGENGVLVPPDDVAATADALGVLAHDPDFRARAGTASRVIVESWGYEPSADAFVEAVLEATGSTLAE